MDHPVNNLSLCSGGGGLDLGLGLAIGNARTICWVEWEAFAIDFLASCMEAEAVHAAPIWTDLRTFDGRPWRGVVDTLTAGYPCQPFSLAGRRLGTDDPRHLWPHVARVIGECQPGVVFLENVPGHLSLGYEQVESDLQEMGYRVTPGLFTAAEVGAPHKRERLFILGVADAPGRGERERFGIKETASAGPESGAQDVIEGMADANPTEGRRETSWAGPGIGAVVAGADRDMADADGAGSQGWGLSERERPDERFIGPGQRSLFPPGPDGDWRGVPYYLWPATESGVCSVADGVAADRVSWLKLLGNGVVPLQAAYAFLSLWAVDRQSRDAERRVA